MSKHTPGPWVVRLCDAGRIEGPIGEHVAQAVSKPADARLIAAAPDLLAALLQNAAMMEQIINAIGADPAETYIRVRVSGGGRELARMSVQQCLDAADAAIAKAEAGA